MSGLEADRGQRAMVAAQERLDQAGLDLVQWFSVKVANRRLSSDYLLSESAGIGAVIGNTRALWRPFRRWRRLHPDVQEALDSYVESEVRASLASLPTVSLRFSHELLPSPIPIQRYAAASGLAQMGPVGLAIHEDFGPWIALRAVALLDLPESCLPNIEERPHPCDRCAAPCINPFQEAMKAHVQTARHFLPVRMSCPVGLEFRYGQEQVDYHYGTHCEPET